jgi:hypothetical protein
MMHYHYNDIRDRISDPPIWWDEVGVPRYCKFGPSETNRIYATEVVYFAIVCQNCEQEFNVALSWHPVNRYPSLRERVELDTLHYGDPPNLGCCPAGPTMNSEPLHVWEFWQKDSSGFGWERVPGLEMPLERGEG